MRQGDQLQSNVETGSDDIEEQLINKVHTFQCLCVHSRSDVNELEREKDTRPNQKDVPILTYFILHESLDSLNYRRYQIIPF